MLGPQYPQNTPHDIFATQESLRLLWSWTSSLSSLYSHTPTIRREGDAIKPVLNSALTFAIFTIHFISVSFPCTGTLSFLLDGVFLIRSLLLSLAIGSLLNIFFKLYIASVCTKHNNNDYKIVTGCGGKKRGERNVNGWPMINSVNYASAQICFRSNMLTIIIFSASATFVELNGKLFWIPL